MDDYRYTQICLRESQRVTAQTSNTAIGEKNPEGSVTEDGAIL